MALLGSGWTPRSDWTPKEYPISFWCGPPADMISVERYKQIAAAGFTHVMPHCQGAFSPDVNRKVLDTAKATGLKAFIFDSRLPMSITGVPDAKSRLDAVVKDYAKHPALAGYWLTDEPNASKFAGLGEVVAYLRAKDPAHPVYINIFPNYADVPQLGAATYAEYVDQYIQTVKPFAVSYDHYHFLKAGDRTGFFSNIDTVRNLSAKNGLPFWQIVLSVPHGSYRPLTEAEKRWEAMQTLAYGGEGLMYFTYWTPSDKSFDWGPAIIKLDGTPTQQYEEVRRINHDVHAIGHYLINSAPVAVFQTGEIDQGGAPREQGTPVNVAGEPNLTVGIFRNDTHLYVLFTNRDYKAAVKVEALLSLGSNRPEHLDKATGRWSEVHGTPGPDGETKVAVDLGAADGELYRW